MGGEKEKEVGDFTGGGDLEKDAKDEGERVDMGSGEEAVKEECGGNKEKKRSKDKSKDRDRDKKHRSKDRDKKKRRKEHRSSKEGSSRSSRGKDADPEDGELSEDGEQRASASRKRSRSRSRSPAAKKSHRSRRSRSRSRSASRSRSRSRERRRDSSPPRRTRDRSHDRSRSRSRERRRSDRSPDRRRESYPRYDRRDDRRPIDRCDDRRGPPRRSDDLLGSFHEWERDRERRHVSEKERERQRERQRERDKEREKIEAKSAKERAEEEEYRKRVEAQLAAMDDEDEEDEEAKLARKAAERKERLARIMREKALTKASVAPTAAAKEAEVATPKGNVDVEMKPAESVEGEAPGKEGESEGVVEGQTGKGANGAVEVGGENDSAREGDKKAATSAPGAEDQGDEEDDMFAIDGPTSFKVKAGSADTQIDGWDDPEGYYRYRVETLYGRYKVCAAIGRGVFSTVVLARDANKADAEVAIKIIRNNETMYKAAKIEIDILEKLAKEDPDNRKHTIRLLSSFEHRDHLCMVFEPMAMNLRQVLKKFGAGVGLGLLAIKKYTKQLLVSLKLLQKCRIIHADIKPDNILVGKDRNMYNCKLSDLGSAFTLDQVEITPFLVSRFYRAPEIVLGLEYDCAVDMWSLGCTIYELFTGKYAFGGGRSTDETRNNNEMLKLFMDLKGRFPNKMIKRARFKDDHFDANYNLLYTHKDAVTKKDRIRVLSYDKPTKDLKKTLLSHAVNEDKRLVLQLSDLLDKIFTIDPQHRISVSEALNHPFVTSSK